MKISKFFNSNQKSAISNAIMNAENNTSGEIRLHIENHCNNEAIERAKVVFEMLQMDKTEQKNGVLIYLAIQDKKIAILGDIGINEVTPDNFWNNILSRLIADIKNGNFTDGIVTAINSIGEKLKKYFPYQSDDINEISDEISFYEN